LRKMADEFGAGNLATRIAPCYVTYIPAIENAFNHMAQRIEQLVYDNKLLSRGLSHDLRTPIARLRFGLDVLEEAELSAPQQKTLAHLNRDLVAMEALVEALLHYARMDQSTITFTPALVNLQQWVSDLVQEFYSDSVEALEIEGDYASNIIADTDYLTMLIHNLLQNAQRHGKGRIRVTIRVDEKQVQLTVEDNGAGIPPEERANVLKPFYRIATTQHTQGHGMGLAIVERIAQWHKAEVQLGESELLGGLKISVLFLRSTQGLVMSTFNQERFFGVSKS
jgi:signal transduction histidine kinase